MDLHLFEPDELPRPRAEVRILQAAPAPLPDGRRVRVEVALTPFSERPNLDVFLLDPAGQAVATFSVIEAIDPRMAFTMHLRSPRPAPGYRLRVVLFYAPTLEARQAAAEKGEQLPDEVVHTLEVSFDVPAPGEDEEPAPPGGPESEEHAAD